MTDNPLLEPWTNPFGLPPFARVRPEHFPPAFDRGMAEHLAEVDAIAGDPAAPTFANTIEALERSGRLLDRVGRLFSNLGVLNDWPPLFSATFPLVVFVTLTAALLWWLERR